ncbi:hypothetical protein J9317_03940 [Metabacillus sp. KIGAM252]|uniref:Ankyrin repeat domain-containing protein n=1 Tax=Metabacillus flavus TaxID=2823519 RepID=A0ABS5LB33_9BACI|nr:hypothetical protein [Metabacillus flavus]MBS2967925.1 hypothetical protein [Metabacillus flavus]
MNFETISTFLSANSWTLVMIIAIGLYTFGKNKEPKEPNNILINSIINNNVTSLAAALEANHGPHSKAASGHSALELAIARNNKYMVAYLMKYGAAPNAKEISAAIKHNNKDIIQLVTTGEHTAILNEYNLAGCR